MNRIYRPQRRLSIRGISFWGVLISLLISPACGSVAESVNEYQLVTGGSALEYQRRWDEVFSSQSYVYGTDPAPFLVESIHRLPRGNALDLATGEGRNAVYLAQRGFTVEGVDISEVALSKAKRLAKSKGVSIETLQKDLSLMSLPSSHYDVVVVFDFFLRDLIPKIKRSLKKDGVVVFEAFTTDQNRNYYGEQVRRDYLLEPGELKRLFSDFEVLTYREVNNGKEAKALLLARKRH